MITYDRLPPDDWIVRSARVPGGSVLVHEPAVATAAVPGEVDTPQPDATSAANTANAPTRLIPEFMRHTVRAICDQFVRAWFKVKWG